METMRNYEVISYNLTLSACEICNRVISYWWK